MKLASGRNHISVLTDDQLLSDLNDGLSLTQIAKKHNVCVRSVSRKKAKLAKRSTAMHSTIPSLDVPDGFKYKRVSRFVTKDGEKAAWLIATEDRDRLLQILEENIKALCEDLPRQKPIKLSNKSFNEDLVNLFVISDFHLGMLSWVEETGANWDCDIAERMLKSWFDEAILRAPKAGAAVFAQLGDFMHFDGFKPETNKSKNIVDTDTRFPKLVRLAIKLNRWCVNRLLEVYPKVHVIMAEGNHDEESSRLLAEMFAVFYEDEKRITVETSPDPFYCYEFGKTTLFFHHGHKVKTESLDSVFVNKFREQYGRSKYSYGHCGHLHHMKSLKEGESRLMEIKQHQTIAAPDAYASRGGWGSRRGSVVITYHKEYGKFGEINVTPEMLGFE